MKVAAERGKESKSRKDAAERGSTPRRDHVSEGADPGHRDEDQLHRQGREIAPGLLADMHREQVPDTGDDQKPERRPSN